MKAIKAWALVKDGKILGAYPVKRLALDAWDKWTDSVGALDGKYEVIRCEISFTLSKKK